MKKTIPGLWITFLRNRKPKAGIFWKKVYNVVMETKKININKVRRRKNLSIIIGTAISYCIFALPAKAVCPVCIITATAGVGLCRWLGIDDTISGIWIGGLTVAVVIWFLSWLNKKSPSWQFKGKSWIIFIASYILLILPLYWGKLIGHPDNKLWGVDKLLLGIIVGSVFFAGGNFVNRQLKKKNDGRPFFHYQKVVLPIVFLAIASVIFYFLNKC